MVKVMVLEYEIRDREGRIIGSSKFEGLMRVRLGTGELWQELEEKLRGLKQGDEAEFEITVPYDEKKIKRLPRKEIPLDEIAEGEQVFIETPAGSYPARIRGVEGEHVIIDLNPPYAGEKVVYKVKVIYTEELI